MRLINTSTFQRREFVGDCIPPYAILSHRWEDEEVLFDDFDTPGASALKGFSKVKEFCRKAASDGWGYGWVDSCCIDKRSSAELSEAINSMFEWYENAEVCYAYLSDVSTGLGNVEQYAAGSELRSSKWWDRGWTLQELLAPQYLIFYDKEWVEIGSKDYLGALISSITGISQPHLLGRYEDASVAQKMSWASRRTTTRPEDMAYSLMGLFQVSMPPLYGEGAIRAFERLQLEIFSRSDDESLFAWEPDLDLSYTPGMLASSPANFIHSGEIYKMGGGASQRPPFTMTNKGLRMELVLIEKDTEEEEIYPYVAALRCRWKSGSAVGIQLARELEDYGEDFIYSQDTFARGTRLVPILKWQEAHSLASTSTVVFVRQSQQRHRRELFLPGYIRRNVPIILTTNSLAAHGFTVLYRRSGIYREGIPWEREVFARAYPSSTPVEKGPHQNLTISMENHEHLLWLAFFQTSPGPPRMMALGDSFEDQFTILLERDRGARGKVAVGIMVPREDMIPQYHDNIVVSDRVSRRLPSGKSVSAALRVGAHEGERVHILDVTLDPTGHLTWLDVDSIVGA